MSEIADGTYRAQALQGALAKTKTGKEQVGVLFQLMDEEGNPTHTITWFGYFTEKTLERTIESLRLCGWHGDDVSNLEGLTDNEVDLVIKQEEYEGTRTPRVRWVNARGSGGLALQSPLEPAEAKSFAQSLRGQILALGQGKPRKTNNKPSGPHGPNPPDITDDIPF